MHHLSITSNMKSCSDIKINWTACMFDKFIHDFHSRISRSIVHRGKAHGIWWQRAAASTAQNLNRFLGCNPDHMIGDHQPSFYGWKMLKIQKNGLIIPVLQGWTWKMIESTTYQEGDLKKKNVIPKVVVNNHIIFFCFRPRAGLTCSATPKTRMLSS